jgi:xylulokinase
MARAVQEGVAFSLRHNLDTAKAAGAGVDKLYAVGGGANSALCMQIKADATGIAIAVPDADNASSLGSALLAGEGIGIYKRAADAAAETIKVKREFYPNPANREVYDRSYERYLELYSRLRGM